MLVMGIDTNGLPVSQKEPGGLFFFMHFLRLGLNISPEKEVVWKILVKLALH